MEKSNYALYIEEREGKSMLEDERGFATYFYPESTIVYIQDVFVRKEHRRSGVARHYFDIINKEAKEKGCSFCITSIDPKAKNSYASERWTEKNGYEFTKNRDNLDWYCKEI